MLFRCIPNFFRCTWTLFSVACSVWLRVEERFTSAGWGSKSIAVAADSLLPGSVLPSVPLVFLFLSVAACHAFRGNWRVSAERFPSLFQKGAE